jgi:hypothetical protein
MQGHNWKLAVLLSATLGLMSTVPNAAIAQSDISRQKPQGVVQSDSDISRQKPQGVVQSDSDISRQKPQGVKDAK